MGNFFLIFLALSLYDAGTGGYTFRHPDVTSNGSSFANSDTPQNGGIGVDNHIVFQYRVAWNTLDGVSLFVARETLGTQCNTLVQFHVIADDAGRTDYDTCTVVNGK